MHKALYRTFRPETFEGILGQAHIVRILKNQIAQGTTGHAYLFCGTRGTGKTSTARILAKGVNCTAEDGEKPCGVCPNCIAIRDGIFVDVIEIDAASNNGVDNIRELRESVNYPPVAGRCKVYIIDEVHMLTTQAFNALLKTLEEPPERVMFLLATTEPQKLPATILSRCLRLDFHRIPEPEMREGLQRICRELSVNISEQALGLIVVNADGSARDALSLLDQCISAGDSEVSREAVLEFLGTSGEEVFVELTDCMLSGNPSGALLLLSRILDEGKDVRQIMKDWIAHYRNLLITKYVDDPEELLNMSVENIDRIREQSRRIDAKGLDRSIRTLSDTLVEAKWSSQPRVLLELCMIRLAEGETPEPIILERAPEQKTVQVSAQVTTQTSATASPKESKETNPAEDEKPDAPEGKTEKKDGGMDVLWQRVTGGAAAERGTLSLLQKRSRLVRMDKNNFCVEVSNGIAFTMARDNAELLENLMEKQTGGALRMEVVLGEQKEETAPKRSGEHLADEIGSLLGIEVEIE